MGSNRIRAWIDRIRASEIHKGRTLVLALAVVVVFVTTYLLVLPALTLEEDAAARQGGVDLPSAEQTQEADAAQTSAEKQDSSNAESEAAAKDSAAADETGAAAGETGAAAGKTGGASGETKAAAGGTDASGGKADAGESQRSAPKDADESGGSNQSAGRQSAEPSGQAGPIAFEGDGYTVEAAYESKAKLPDGAELIAEQVDPESDEYKAWCDEALKALQEDGEDISKLRFAQFYDISLQTEDGSVEPSSPVNVTISYDEAVRISDADNIRIVHFAADQKGKLKPEILEATPKTAKGNTKKMKSASFDTDSFSMFGVVEPRIEKTVLASDGKGYKVTAVFDEKEELSDEARLEVMELREGDEGWMDRSVQLAHTLYDNYGNVIINDARMLRIKVLDGNKEIEPKHPVEVRIEYASALNTKRAPERSFEGEIDREIIPDDPSRFVAIHYEKEGQAELLKASVKQTEDGIEETSFVTSGFSDYDMAYLFEYDTPKAGQKVINTSGVTAKKVSLAARKAAAEDSPVLRALNDDGSPSHAKTLDDNHDGTYTIGLNVTGDADTTQKASNVNVIIVYDISSSMTLYNVPSPTGQYGRISSSATAYNNEQLYRRNGNRYSAISDSDNYTGTVYYRNGYSNYYSEYHGTRYANNVRANVAEKALYDFTHALFGYQDPENPSNIQASLITFAGSASTTQAWTSTESAITNRIKHDGVSHSLNYSRGTNWEAALRRAQTVAGTADSDPTYVVFITDGAPTSSEGHSYTSNFDHYMDATDEARALYNSTNGNFFGIYAYGEEADYLASLMYYASTGSRPSATIEGTTFDTDGYYNASDTSALNDAINAIFQRIVQTLGVSAVSITDGTTSHVETTSGEIAHLLDVDTSSYQYWMTIPVTGSGNTYTFTMPDKVTGSNVNYTAVQSGENVTISWDGGSAAYPGSVNLNNLTLKWSQATNFYRFAPPAASFDSSSGAVNWSLASLGTLLDGVTYTVTFDCYPSQDTLDAIADLKNGKIQYSDLDEEVRQYLLKNGNEYELKTNTSASLTYTDTREENPEPVTTSYTNPEPVGTSAVQALAITKKWENELDGRAADSIDLDVTRDGTDRYDVTLSEENGWSNQAYVSIGIMTIHDGVVSIKTPGHDFSFAEPDNLAYYWEIDVPTVHPMKINGTDTILVEVKGEEIPAEMMELESPARYTEDGAAYYKMYYNGADRYYKADAAAASLTATNSRRSSLNVTKRVIGSNAPANALFDFTMKVNNPQNDDVWFSIWDENNQFVKNTDDVTYVSGATAEIRDGAATGYFYAASGTQISFKLKAGWNLRFTNLPTGTTYEVTESSTMPDDCFDFVSVAGDREYYEYAEGEGTADPVTRHEPTGTAAGRKLTGTIEHTNSIYTAAYTNQYNAAAVTVTKEADYDDGTAFEIIATVTQDGEAVSSLPTQSDHKVSFVEGHPDQLKITLKSGETASLNLKEGMTLSIEETESADYTAAYSYKLTPEGEERTGSVIDSISDGNAMTVTNTVKRADIHLNKVEKGSTTLLPGSEFKLYRKNSSGVYTSDESIEAAKSETILALTDGTLLITGLPPGDYKLSETHAPDGFIINTKDIYFTVNAAGTGDVITKTPGQEGFDSEDIGAGTSGTNKDTLVIPNTPGAELPSTGGEGTVIYYLGGILLLLGAGTVLLLRRRRAS